jgi:hypothetical protein
MDSSDRTTNRKFNWPTLVLFLCLFGGALGFVSYLVDELNLTDDIIMPIVFALAGGMFFVMLLRERKLVWRILTTVAWSMTIMAFGSYLGDVVHMHDGLIAALVLPSIGGLIYAMFHYYPAKLASATLPQTQFRQLGSADERIDPLQNPAARDVPAEQRGR